MLYENSESYGTVKTLMLGITRVKFNGRIQFLNQFYLVFEQLNFNGVLNLTTGKGFNR